MAFFLNVLDDSSGPSILLRQANRTIFTSSAISRAAVESYDVDPCPLMIFKSIYILNNEIALLCVLGILLAHAVSAALKARPKFKIATTSTTTTTTSTTEEPHVEENDQANSEVRKEDCNI